MIDPETMDRPDEGVAAPAGPVTARKKRAQRVTDAAPNRDHVSLGPYNNALPRGRDGWYRRHTNNPGMSRQWSACRWDKSTCTAPGSMYRCSAPRTPPPKSRTSGGVSGARSR